MTRRKKSQKKINIFRVLILGSLLAAFIVAGAGVGFVAGAVKSMPNFDISKLHELELTTYIYDDQDKQISTLHVENRVELQTIPENVKNAVIAIEDERFEKHFGVDLYGLGRAVVANITKGYGSEGASTITQQLVKIAILENPEKKMKRKIQEALLAIQVERNYSKDEIMKMYLNTIYYGHGAHSLQTASKAYFGKDARDLTLSESAVLAGVINRPGKYSPYLNMENAINRRDLVLNQMAKVGFITKLEAEEAKKEKIVLAGLKSKDYKNQSFVDFIIEEAAKKLEIKEDSINELYTKGYKIYTTLDTPSQQKAEEIYANPENFPPDKNGKIVQSAFTAIDTKTGAIKVMVGGRNQQGERQFNRAVKMQRQPGSVFKPIAVYGPALEIGYSPATVIDDVPEQYPTPQGPKVFQNYDNKYRGLISMRTALQYSVNVTAVKMLDKIGVSEGFNFAQRLGITTLVESGPSNDRNLSLSLGGLTKGVSPLELASAYQSFANKGVRVEPYAVRKIEDTKGNVLYEHKPSKTIVMSEETAYLMNSMLKTVVQAGTGKRAQMANNRPVAGKTGTTSFDRDAWFVGYTNDYVGVIWLGYDKEDTMTKVFGGSAGAPIWKEIMEVLHKDRPISDFPVPANITTAQVDYKSGLLPSPLTPPEFVTTELFAKNNVPTEISSVWVEKTVGSLSGKLWTENCPEIPITKVYLERPIPYVLLDPKFTPEDAYLEVPKDYCSGSIDATSPIKLQGSAIKNDSELVGVRLSWKFDQATVNTIYQIFRGTEPDFPLTPQNQIAQDKLITGNSFEDKAVLKDKMYYYRIIAIDQETGLVSEPSNQVSAPKEQQQNTQINVPQLTARFNSKDGRPVVELNWTKPTNDSPYFYFLFRSEKRNFSPSPETQIAYDANLTGTSYIDENVESGKSYYYKIIAFDQQAGRQSPISSVVEVKVE